MLQNGFVIGSHIFYDEIYLKLILKWISDGQSTRVRAQMQSLPRSDPGSTPY